MVTAQFRVDIPFRDWPVRAQSFVEVQRKKIGWGYLPTESGISTFGWRCTETISEGRYNDDLLDRSNYDFMLKQLRERHGESEGHFPGSAWSSDAPVPDSCLWIEADNGCILWRSTLTTEEVAALYAFRVHTRYYPPEMHHLYDEEIPPVLDDLLDFCHSLSGYPVLDEDDFSEREYNARIEQIVSELPHWFHTRTQAAKRAAAERVHEYLDRDNDYNRDERGIPNVPDKFACSMEGEHISSPSDKYLDECVKHACRALHMCPHAPRKRG